jgi:hypothetical protein
LAIVETGNVPFSSEEMLAVWNQNVFQHGPMFISSRQSYKHFTKRIEDYFWPKLKKTKEPIMLLKGHD